jgi:hypothetical protein
MTSFFVFVFMLHTVSANLCVLCPSGKFQSSASNLPCQLCEMNTYAPLTGMKACLPCPRTFVSGRGSSNCTCPSNYTLATDSSACIVTCENGLVAVNGSCQCPAGSSGPTGGPCSVCPMHTYRSNGAIGTCTDCPTEMRSPTGSVSIDACLCGPGFVKNSTGVCSPIADTSIRIETRMALQIPEGASDANVRQTLKSAISLAYNFNADYLTLNMVKVSQRRRLLQIMSATLFDIQLRLLFPVGVSAAQVEESKQKIAPLETAKINTAISSVPDKTPIVVTTVAQGTSMAVDPGVVNTISGEVLDCQTIAWSDTRGTTLVCARTCGTDEEVFAVAYVQGTYVLDCRRRTGTTVRTETPIPKVPATGDTMLIVLAVVGLFLLLCLGLVARICFFCNPSPKND